MEPKKKSSLGFIIGVISLIFALYMGMEAGMAWSDAVETTGGSVGFPLLLQNLTDRLNGGLFENFFFDDYVKKGLAIGAFAWFLIFLMANSNKRNFIRGKEYGTARWGTRENIKDLFAKNIERQQISEAKMVKNKILRKILYYKKKKQWKTEKQKLHNGSMKLLEVSFAAELLDAKAQKGNVSALKKQQAERKSKRLKELAEEEKALWREMWEPARIEYEYENSKKEIDRLAKQGLAVTAESKPKEIAKIEAARKEAYANFHDSEARVLKIQSKFRDADCLLTHTERTCLYNYKINNNVLIVGGAGAGKSRGFVVPNLLQAHSSYVVTDPKGEVLEKTGTFLKENGYKIRVLNLDEKEDSDCYNPFNYIHPERKGYEERILSLINTMIKATTKDKNSGSSDPFWDNAEKLFLQAIFFFVVDGYAEEERNMNTVLELIAMLEIGEEQDDKQSDLDHFAERFEAELNERDTVNHNAGTLNNGVKAWKEFRNKASGKTAKSIVITAVARLSPFRTSGIRRIMAHDDMELERLGEEKMVVFIVVPPTDDTFNFIAAMMFTQMFQELQYCATQVHKHDGQRLPIPVRFILDEFANTCAVPEFEKILAYARSFGIGIVPILQSLDQLKALYKDTWRTIIDNCSSMLYLGSVSSDETLKYISDLLGKGTFDKKTTGRTRGRNGSSSENYDVIGRELMTPDEIRRMDKSKCLLIISGRYPFYSDKYDMTEHKNYSFTSDGNHKYSYHHVRVATLNGADEVRKAVTKQAKAIVQTQVQSQQDSGEEKAAAYIAQVDKEVSSIRLDTDSKNVLKYAMSRVEQLAPKALKVNDGESDAVMQTAVEECLTGIYSENDSFIEAMVSSAEEQPSSDAASSSQTAQKTQTVEEKVDEVLVEAQNSADKIQLDTRLKTVAGFVVDSIKKGEPLKPVDVSVPDGECPHGEDIETVLESESKADAEALADLEEQNIGDMSQILDDFLNAG